jgi:hypothetical protein
MKPGDFAIGSLESGAIARLIAQRQESERRVALQMGLPPFHISGKWVNPYVSPLSRVRALAGRQRSDPSEFRAAIELLRGR